MEKKILLPANYKIKSYIVLNPRPKKPPYSFVYFAFGM